MEGVAPTRRTAPLGRRQRRELAVELADEFGHGLLSLIDRERAPGEHRLTTRGARSPTRSLGRPRGRPSGWTDRPRLTTTCSTPRWGAVLPAAFACRRGRGHRRRRHRREHRPA